VISGRRINVDELPELRSDEDVDALMARLRAKLAPDVPPASPPQPNHEPSGDPWSDFLGAQREFTGTMLRAVRVLADAVDEYQGPGSGTIVTTSPSSPRRASRTTTSRKGHRRIRR
jgi:hypothetical protein